MRYCHLLSLIAVLWCIGLRGFCQLPCEVNFLRSVELQGEELSLADVLGPNTCPSLLRSAAQVSLGKSPLEGSSRVFEGTPIRALVDRVARSEGIRIKLGSVGYRDVPERIVVRRAGLYLSCSDIAARVILHPEETAVNGEMNCGALGRIRKDVSLDSIRKTWDPALQSWDFTMRCARLTDCVPFLVRVAGSNSGRPQITAETSRGTRSRTESIVDSLLHAGQKTTLLWEQDGIRMVLPAICLDAGRKGDTVRVRVASGSRIMQATVTAQGTLVVER